MNSWLEFVVENWPVMVNAATRHLLISLGSVLLGMLVAIPGGIYLTRHQRAARVVASHNYGGGAQLDRKADYSSGAAKRKVSVMGIFLERGGYGAKKSAIKLVSLTLALAFVERVYGLKFKDTKSMDIGLKYQALASRQIDVTDAFATDGQLLKYKTVVLEDDKHLYPPYYAAPIVRMDTLKQHPELEIVLNSLGGQISDQEMREVCYEVEVNNKEIADVAKEFLTRKHLI